MATNDDFSSGPKRIRRTSRKAASTLDTPAQADEDIVVRSAYAAPSSGGLLSRGGVRSVDVTNFLRQLIMLLDAGTPILKSLQTLAHRGERPAARALVADITQYVEAGNPLWQAFDRHPRYFDSVFVNLIKASEASGTLTTVLRRVLSYREHREMMTKRIRGAMLYPVLLLVACLGVMLLITWFVVPSFQDMFTRTNMAIPQVTQIFFAISHWVGRYFWLPILGLVALYVLYQTWYLRSPIRRMKSDRRKLRIPIIGPIAHKSAIVELTRTMALLLRSGLSMMSTLDLTRNAIYNRAVAQSLQAVRDSIEVGGGMEEPLRRCSNVIPPVITDMFVTGEESGSVDQICEQIADIYEEEVRIAVDSLGEAIQPIFTILVGIAVITLFIALFMPLVSMIDQISGSGGSSTGGV